MVRALAYNKQTIIFGILTENKTPGSTESLNNKLQVFLNKTKYREYKCLSFLKRDILNNIILMAGWLVGFRNVNSCSLLNSCSQLNVDVITFSQAIISFQLTKSDYHLLTIIASANINTNNILTTISFQVAISFNNNNHLFAPSYMV